MSKRSSRIHAAMILMLGLSLLVIPGSIKVAQAGAKQVLKFAVMVPRSPSLAVEEKRYNKRLAELTDGQVQVRVYWGGAAGGEQDVVRKMRTGQIDGTPLSLDVMSQFVRECLVLQTPGLFNNYKQVDAVRKALTPQFDEEAYRNGFKVIVWGDIGRLRLFSKKKISRINDFKASRPWLYPESEMLKEFYKQIGATGVPLDIAEVYGGMQTGMIDTYWATSALAAALQWHRTAKYVSGQGLGFISGAVLFRREAWDNMPEVAKKAMQDIVDERAKNDQRELRMTDEKIYKRLLKRGFTAVDAQDPAEWWNAGKQLRHRLVGRIYTKKLVDKAEKIALKYADKEQLAYWK
ncbi:MAG: TRAP transporter substrate-binding protein DctP [Myxococcales bacterium]|nr:TRAP transporter substrate-binding protein DctP [Myxococcales bacterium]